MGIMVKLVWIIFLFFSSILRAEYTVGFSGAQNWGEHIFETGNKYPNLSGIRGGSRITYNREFPWAGVGGTLYKGHFAFIGNFSTTGWNHRTVQKSRDEDFLMGNISTEKGTKFSIWPPFLYDTTYTFSGTQNFADGIGKSTVNQYALNGSMRYYLDSESSPWTSKSSWFFSLGLRYTYFKYLLYDVVQFVQRPYYYGPIGIGLTYSYTSWEIPLGAGYAVRRGNWRMETSLHLLVGYSQYRDFHIQRALNFIGSSLGNGFLYQVSINYLLNEQDFLFLNYEGHRYFGYSFFHTKGGLSQEDILSNYSGKYRSYISTKETSLEFGIRRRFGSYSLEKEKKEIDIPSKVEEPVTEQ